MQISYMTASILYPSITTRLRRLTGTFWHLVRSIVRELRIFFVAANSCSSPRNVFRPRENSGKKSLDRRDQFQKSSKLEPSWRFLSHLKIENSLATFGRIQPIVLGCIALYPHSGTNLGTIGRIRQKVTYEVLNFRYF